jgi:NADH-quinone oxidoreductase subunit L
MFLSEASSGFDYFRLVPLIVLIPAAGLLLNTMFGKRWGEKITGTVASLAVGSAFVVSVLQLIGLHNVHYEAQIVKFAEWLHIGDFYLPWEFRVDTLSVIMMLVVSGVGTLIHIYATGYMHFDVRYKEDTKSYARFFIFMNLFIAMMMILVS